VEGDEFRVDEGGGFWSGFDPDAFVRAVRGRSMTVVVDHICLLRDVPRTELSVYIFMNGGVSRLTDNLRRYVSDYYEHLERDPDDLVGEVAVSVIRVFETSSGVI
jgi:hypothetical protein